MEKRSFLTWIAIGLVAVVALLALADALRDAGSSTRRVADTVATDLTATSENPEQPAGQAENWPVGRLAGVLTFVDADDCTIRSIELSTGAEQPIDRYETACGGFWAPRTGPRVAFVQPFEDGGAVRFVDLRPGGGELGRYIGAGDIHWSADGERATWCTARRSGFRPYGIEIEFPGDGQKIPVCPVAYTAEGALAYIQGNRLIVDGRTVVRARTPIGSADFAADGTVVAVDFLGRIYRAGERTVEAHPVPGWTRQPPAFSPDLCLAVFPRVLGLTEVEIGCRGQSAYRQLPGNAAAWSPDGLWLAVAAPGEIQFYPARSTEASKFSLPVGALALAWRAG